MPSGGESRTKEIKAFWASCYVPSSGLGALTEEKWVVYLVNIMKRYLKLFIHGLHSRRLFLSFPHFPIFYFLVRKAWQVEMPSVARPFSSPWSLFRPAFPCIKILGVGLKRGACCDMPLWEGSVPQDAHTVCVCVCVCVSVVCTHSIMSDSLQPHGLVACQAPLSMRFFRQEYRSGLPFPCSGDLPDPGIEPVNPELAEDFLPFAPLDLQPPCAGEESYCWSPCVYIFTGYSAWPWSPEKGMQSSQ